MVFSSLNFLLVFLPIVLILYFIVPLKIKNIVLLAASIIFYAWGEPVYIILMVLSIGFNYMAGLLFGEALDERQRKIQLIIAVCVNIGILGFFKYAVFFVDVINSATPLDLRWKGLALPVGISFYTFQALSYVIDVYRGKVKPQRSVINFALYITMFPQLVAGPIVRYTEIEEQLANRTINALKCGQGMERLIWGLSKKVLLANNLGLLYSTIQSMTDRSVMTAWLGAAAYTLQIYFDFSGYSDMAIGMGKMLGFNFPENFNFPYMAKNITEFWRRWHMTLSGWFREYVYIPLGGNRVPIGRHILNLLIVWMLTGMWHGAGWNFILWGLYYGVILIVEKYLLAPFLERLPDWAQHLYTMILVALGWVLFSNTEFSDMICYFGNLFGKGAAGFIDHTFFYYLRSNLVLLLLGGLCSGPFLRDRILKRSRKSPIITGVISLVLFLLCIAYLVYGSYNPFLYFRF